MKKTLYFKGVGNDVEEVISSEERRNIAKVLGKNFEVLTNTEIAKTLPEKVESRIRECFAYVIYILPSKEKLSHLVTIQIKMAVDVCNGAETNLIVFSEWESIDNSKKDALLYLGVKPEFIYDSLEEVIDGLNS